MKVYIVLEYDDYARTSCIRNLFSSKEKANEYIKSHNSSNLGIEEFEIDSCNDYNSEEQ